MPADKYLMSKIPATSHVVAFPPEWRMADGGALEKIQHVIWITTDNSKERDQNQNNYGECSGFWFPILNRRHFPSQRMIVPIRP